MFELCGILIKITSKHTQQYYPPKGGRGYLLFYMHSFETTPKLSQPTAQNNQLSK